MGKIGSVNVDVDSLYLYCQIHDLDPEAATNVVWERGVVRFLELFAELGIRATFFAVASDLARWPEARAVAERVVAEGHELANHTWSHPYDLIHRSPSELEDEIVRAHGYLSELRGRPVAGFRAPGYHMNEAIYQVLAERGYAYSSSLLPSPPYHLAKLAVMARMALAGEQTRAIAGDPRIMLAPTRPHARSQMLELPITVLPGLRFPFIGTSLVVFGRVGYQLMRPLARLVRFMNLEFHGIDLCDLELDGIDPGLKKQPDLRVPLEQKRDVIRTALRELSERWEVRTLEEAAPLFAGQSRRA